jgi:PTH1 family peptidyl-tRNA hydrolase
MMFHSRPKSRLVADIGGSSALHLVNPRTRQMRAVIEGRRKVSGFSFDAQGRSVAYVSTSVTQPTELFIAGADGRGERKLTSFNDALNREVAWSDAERLTFRSVGNVEIEGWLMKPTTFMNASGDAAAAVSRFYKISPAECLVIADDVDLPLGRLKMKLDGSPAGHNGLKSLISKLGTAAFPRLKVGIAGAQGGRPAGEQMVSHVLGDFHPDERPLVSQMVNRSADAVETSLRLGLAATMNLFNRKEESQTPN